MGWKLLKTFSEVARNYCPLVGRVWMPVLFVFRVAILISIGNMIYGDEKTSFICRSNESGCSLACLSDYTPVGHLRLWTLQIFCVGTLSAVFIIYSILKIITIISKLEQAKQAEEPSQSTKSSNNNIALASSRTNVSNSNKNLTTTKVVIDQSKSCPTASRSAVKDTKNQSTQKYLKPSNNLKISGYQLTSKSIALAYLLQVILRIVIECGFLSLQYNLYKWKIPDHYDCTALPCIYTVKCYISQPMEKTIFLWLMYSTTVISLLLSFGEIVRVFYKAMRRASIRRFRNSSWHLMSEDYIPMNDLTET